MGTAALALAAGACGDTEARPEPSVAGPEATVAYYQPYADKLDAESLVVPSHVYTMVAEPGKPNSWTIGDCQPDNAANFLEAHPSVEKVVGYSLGRVGLAYLIAAAGPERLDTIRHMVAVAPGNREDFFVGSCDPTSGQPLNGSSTSELVGDWLSANPDNRFMIVADQRTAEGGTYDGVTQLYLDGLAGTAVEGQVQVCASDLGHFDIWNAVKSEVLRPVGSDGASLMCPSGTTPYEWR